MKSLSERCSLPVLRRKLIAVAAFALCSGQVLAADPFTVKDIRVEGIQRTEAGTVFSYLPVRVGETFTDEKGIAAIKALYATGFFKDVKLEVENGVLIVLVEERPTIASVDFTGTKEFEKDALQKALKEIGVGETRIFDKATVDRAEQELKKQYLSRGLYGAQVTTKVVPIERNRVNVTFEVDEGEIARIKQVNIIGNKAFTDKELREAMELSPSNWLSWYSKSDQYSKTKLTGDLETIKSYYLDRGYLEANIESTQVSISPDKKDIYLTINLTEGEKYNISEIKFEGEMFGREEELKSLMLVRAGRIYSGTLLTESTKRISEKLGTYGYAFANINVNPEIDRDKRTVALTVMVDPGKRVYVRRINMAGNTRTRDEVIRREMRQFENSWYDGNAIKASRDRIDRLGYFKDVTVETPEVAGVPDQVDVNMTVTEKPTGNFTLGAGYSQAEKLTISASVQQANFAGSGTTVGFELNTSKYNRTYALSQTDPYYTDEGISRSYELFVRTSRPYQLSVGDYRIVTQGGRLSYGVPFSEYDVVFFGLGLERTSIETFENSPYYYQQYVQQYGDGHIARTNAVPLTAAWQRDSRDSAVTPTVGRYQRFNAEVDVVGSQKYYRLMYQHQYYRPIYKGISLALIGEADYGRGIGGRKYPLFKNFYAGGIGSVRAYQTSSLGAVDPTTYDPQGGSTKLTGSAELHFPFPGAGNDRTLHWFTFLDGGNVFQEHQRVQLNQMRYSAGVGVSWIAPVGPLKLSYGKPLNAKPGDRLERFQFSMGSGF
jgi:outer membrane protein insertion porin family